MLPKMFSLKKLETCFSKREMGPLVPVEGIITAKEYKELLEKYLLPIFKKSNYQLIFMQDNANAPIYEAKLVMDFLADGLALDGLRLLILLVELDS
jgi:hypothetical protein